MRRKMNVQLGLDASVNQNNLMRALSRAEKSETGCKKMKGRIGRKIRLLLEDGSAGPQGMVLALWDEKWGRNEDDDEDCEYDEDRDRMPRRTPSERALATAWTESSCTQILSNQPQL